MFEEIKEMTQKLVSIPSINTTTGEKDIADFIYQYILKIPYFAKNPQLLLASPLKDDPLGRKNILALLKGADSKKKKTILFHGHTDTVGVEDYADLKEFAFCPEELMNKLLSIDLSESVKKDLLSGDYLFGRGSCDMKSGVAVFLVLLKHLAASPEALNGNLLFMFNPVEENLHTGMIESLDLLEALSQKEKLEFLFAINNDYICPLFEGDQTRYLYTGAVGKLLPCFYIMGKETHVGQCFEGFDASLTAASLIEEINLNPLYSDLYNGELTLPPTVLKMKDLKDFYNVQTANSTFVYFNYFVHNKNMEDINSELLRAAQKALTRANALQEERSLSYAHLSNTLKGAPKDFVPYVYTFDDLCEKVRKETSLDPQEVIKKIIKEKGDHITDKRELSLEITKQLSLLLHMQGPAIILFYAAPYCPHNTLIEEDPKDQILLSHLNSLLAEFQTISQDTYKILHYFPSLSDSSYLKIDDAPDSIEKLITNFPAYELLYPIPVDQIRRIQIPALNYGCYGKDAHKWTERVYMPYSFDTLPKMLLKTIDYFFNKTE